MEVKLNVVVREKIFFFVSNVFLEKQLIELIKINELLKVKVFEFYDN